MSMNVSVQENWSIEPELTEMPPRRVVLSEYPDLNRPNPMIMYGAGGVLAVGGVVVLIIGLNGANTLLSILGIIITLLGAGVIGFLGPYLTKRHLARGEHLVKNGVPVMARLLSAENMSGDYRFGRSVTYQVGLPNGDLVHRSVNADDRLLPRKIPANITALMDIQTSDVELYCVLPYKVQPNPAVIAARAAQADPLAANAITTPTTAVNPGHMGTIDVGGIVPATRRPKEETQETKPQPTQTGNAGLPWE